MTERKTYYFKVEGRIYAEDCGEATDYLWNLLTNKTERFKITEVTQIDD